MEFDFSKPVLVLWKTYRYLGQLVKRTNQGKSYVVKLDNGLVRQVKAERIVQA
jgi:hypothetical protein